ncbi:MAG: hypothetical protein QOJ55_49, partial [Solirubrobacteraceae bacterium]|nr:hypothetical protein [Solirubrobacteraceae bacterium]
IAVYFLVVLGIGGVARRAPAT